MSRQVLWETMGEEGISPPGGCLAMTLPREVRLGGNLVEIVQKRFPHLFLQVPQEKNRKAEKSLETYSCSGHRIITR